MENVGFENKAVGYGIGIKFRGQKRTQKIVRLLTKGTTKCNRTAEERDFLQSTQLDSPPIEHVKIMDP